MTGKNCQWSPNDISAVASLNGGAENDGHENYGTSKLQGMKLQDMKLQDTKVTALSTYKTVCLW